MKTIVLKSMLMMFLIVSFPFLISVDVRADDSVPVPGEQCLDKTEEGKAFVEFMDGGIIKTLETIAALMMGIATVVNTIDTVITTISQVIGMIGPQAGTCCPAAAFGPGGIAACNSVAVKFEMWEKIKGTGIMDFIISQATCACCSGKRAKEGANTLAQAGTNWGVCPLGDISNWMGKSLPGQPTQAGEWGADEGVFDSGGRDTAEAPKVLPIAKENQRSSKDSLFTTKTTGEGDNKQYGQQDQYYNVGKGISQFHFSAFDNIYTAVGCMCPVAILFNLRKLKTIYQVHNCCVQEACKNGYSTESCEKQLDEATCMYWEGGIMKTAILLLASVFAGYISKLLWSKFKKSVLLRCILLAFEVSELPARVMAVTSAFDWLSETFKEPECSDLGFDDVKKQYESGYWSQGAGIRYTMSDQDYDGVYDSVAAEADNTAADTGSANTGTHAASDVTTTASQTAAANARATTQGRPDENPLATT